MHGYGGLWVGCMCVCEWVVVFSDQTNIVRERLRVGSESKLILALQN